jgi:trans-aconitate methyltransferase
MLASDQNGFGCLLYMSDSNAQRWDPARYERSTRFVSDLGMPVVALLAPRDGERILGLGCGDGALAIKLVKLGCTVVGVDASVEMVAAATPRGLDASVMDGQSLQFADEFDAVFSNAALHWMKDPRGCYHRRMACAEAGRALRRRARR